MMYCFVPFFRRYTIGSALVSDFGILKRLRSPKRSIAQMICSYTLVRNVFAFLRIISALNCGNITIKIIIHSDINDDLHEPRPPVSVYSVYSCFIIIRKSLLYFFANIVFDLILIVAVHYFDCQLVILCVVQFLRGCFAVAAFASFSC